MRRRTVLVTAAGTVVAQGVVKCLKLANSVRGKPESYRILTADMSPLAAGLYRSDLGVIVPKADAEGYAEAIVKLCREEAVEALFVGADEELHPIASARERIEKESGAVVVSNPMTVLKTGTDKWKTFEFLKKNRLPSADSALPEDKEEFARRSGFPLVAKPREGHGSIDFHVVNNPEELDHAIQAIKRIGLHPIIQEYLGDENPEFTTGVTVEKGGGYVMSSIAMKRTLKGGQTYKAFVDEFKEIRESAKTVALKLGCRGPVNIQAKLVDEVPKVFEINPRISASCPIRAVAGVNEPDILFRNFVLGEKISVEEYRRMVCMRYWNEVYVPYSTYEEAANRGRTDGKDSLVSEYF
ncbi:MAG: ATP-grasp domain-containing protein [Thaumarchaeota archaeon]|nr:MAG: ATP-grasp domain-containing protein [Nitrososphaerota archaeon]